MNCLFGHKWSRWHPTYVTIQGREVLAQHHWCVRCRKIEIERIAA